MNRYLQLWCVRTSCLLVLLFLSGSPAKADQEVAYRLKWLVNMSTVGDVYAKDHGYFEAQGLQVRVKAGGPERDAIRELELGYAQFGVASADQVIRALSKGAPLVVLAQLFQTNPLQWIYRPNKTPLDTPAALAGKTIGVTFGKNDEFIMRTLLTRAGIRENQVRLYSVRLDYTPFYNGDVELWPIYINTQGIEIGNRMKRAGERIAFLEPGKFGIRFVANSVVTSKRLLADNPDLVKRFMKGLLAGWRDSLAPANAQKAVETVRQYDRDASNAVLKAQLNATRMLMLPGPEHRLGYIDTDAWKQTEKIMLDYGQIPQAVNVAASLKPMDAP